MDKMIAFCKSNSCLWVSADFRIGFWVGLLLAVLIVLAYLVIVARKGANKGISIEEKGGLFFLSVDAIRTFLRSVVHTFPNIELKDLKLKKRNGAFLLKLYLQAPAGSDLVDTRKNLREEIFKEIKAKLGLGEELQTIDLEFKLIEKKKTQEM
ncbi:MAG: hypothetical protein WCS73_08395 [Lentisphaeria bacterium]